MSHRLRHHLAPYDRLATVGSNRARRTACFSRSSRCGCGGEDVDGGVAAVEGGGDAAPVVDVAGGAVDGGEVVFEAAGVGAPAGDRDVLDVDVVEAEAREERDVTRDVDGAVRAGDGPGAGPAVGNRDDVGQDDAAAGGEDAEGFAQEGLARVEMEGGLDAEDEIERRPLEGEAGGVHLEE